MTRTRSPWLIGLAVLFVLTVATAGVSELISETFHGRSVEDRTLTSAVARLELDADQGDVEIVPSPDGDVHVRTDAAYGLREPVLTRESTATGVRLASRCRDGVVAASCRVGWTVAVPAGFTVDVDAGAGSLKVRDLTGPVTLKALGDVELSGLSGDVTARSTYGDITGAGLRSGSVTVASISGDVDLTLTVPPHSVSATVTAVGDVSLAVPGSQAYRVDAEPGRFGDRKVTVPQDPASLSILRAVTGGGTVTLRPL
ncbi:hypothetical protein GCM10009836_15300 [Pseudonocardia ailaonensis]|uniref:Adhesin domain-containing protein n=1 Tax=Pseudonocardia ailaonensis TaxID=367279 RepID=A0ABN2MSR6_9PSEU